MTQLSHIVDPRSIDSPPVSGTSRSRALPVAVCGAVFLSFFAVVFALQHSGFGSEMVYDSAYFINSKAALFQQHEWMRVISIVPARPLFLLSFYVNYLLSGMDVYYFRVGNALLLAGTGLALTLLAAVIFETPGLGIPGTRLEKRCVSVLLGLLFVAHPMQTYVVLYIWQREAIMACLFYFAALASYLGGRSGFFRSPATAYSLTAVLFLAGWLSKENLVTFPAALVLAELVLFRQGRRDLASRLAVIVAITVPVAAVYFLITFGLHGDSSEVGKGVLARIAEHYDYAKTSLVDVALTQSRVLFAYLFMTLAPVDPEFMRPEQVSRSLMDPPSTLLACLGVAGLIGLSIGLLRRKPLVAFGILFYLMALLPESLLIPQYLFFSYRALLPMAGLLLIIGWAALTVLDTGKEKLPAIAVRGALAGASVIALLVLGWVTVSVAGDWSPLTFWKNPADRLPRYSDNLEIVPYLDISMNYMAVLAAAQKYEEAIDLFKKVAGISQPIDGLKETREATEKFVGMFGPQTMRAAAGLIGLGVALSGTGKLAEAAESYKKALEMEPFHTDVWVCLGSIVESEGDPTRAMGYYRKALEIDASSVMAYQSLGSALFKAGNFQEAAEELDKAAQLEPNSAANHLALAAALEQAGYIPEAVKEYRRAVELDPGSADSYYRLGRAQAHSGELNEALSAYWKAIELDPNQPTVYADLGLALDYAGSVFEAVQAYRSSLALDPSSAVIHNLLGLALKRAGNLAEAIEEYRQAIAIDPGLGTAYNNLGVALEKSGRLPEAVVQYRKAIETDPESAIAYNNLGVALKKSGEMNAAIEHYGKALELDPNLAVAHANLASIAEEGGDPERVADVCRKVLQGKPDSVEANFGLANALLKKRDYKESIQRFRRAVQLRPDLVQAHAKLAVALLNNGEVAEAIVTLGQALALNEENADLFNSLGLAFAEMKKPREAAEQFRKALALEPLHVAARRNLEKLSKEHVSP